MVIDLGKSISEAETMEVLLKGYADTLDEQVSYFVAERTLTTADQN